MKIEVRVSTNKIGSETKEILEIDDDEIAGAGRNRTELIEDYARDAMFELINWNWEEIK